MKMNEIVLEIGTNVEKSLNKIQSLISKFKNLDSSSQNVANTMKKVSDVISPTTAKLGNINNTVKKTSDTLRNDLVKSSEKAVSSLSIIDKLKADPKIDVKQLISSKDEAISIIKQLYTTMQSFKDSSGKLKISSLDSGQFKEYQEYGRLVTKIGNSFKIYDTVKFSPTGVKEASKVVNVLNKYLSSTHLKLSKVIKSFSSLSGVGTKLKNVISSISKKFTGFGKNASKSTDSLLNKLKKLGLGLLSIRTAMSLLTKAVTSYLTFDGALQDSITNSWNVLGSLLAPAIEFVASLFATATTYVYNFVKALTGIDLVARANAKALQTQAKATKSAAAQAQRSLTAMDEITNLQTESAGGNGVEIPQIEVPQIEVSDIFSRLIEAIKNGEWYEVGNIIADGINTAFGSINWGSIQSSAQIIGTNVGLIFNGLFENLDWYLVGSTIGNGIQTAISFAYGFVTTFNWSAFGTGIGSYVNGLFDSIDWAMLGKTVSDGIKGILDVITNYFQTVDWEKLGEDIKNFFQNIDWKGIAKSTLNAIGSAFGGLDDFLTGLFGEAGATTIETIVGTLLTLVTAIKLITIALTVYNVVQSITMAGAWPIIGIIALIVTAIAAVIAIIVTIIKHFDKIKETFINVCNAILDFLSPVIDFVSDMIGTVVDNIVITINNIKQIVSVFVKYFKEIFGPLWDGLVEGFAATWGAIKMVFSPAIDFFSNIINKIKNIIVKIATSVGNIISGAFKSVVNGILNAIENILNFPIKAINTLINVINKVPGIELTRLKTFNLPRLATGTNEIPQEGIYHLHEGEAVVPKKYNPATGGYNDGSDNRQIIDLLVSLNANMLAFSEKTMTINIDGNEVARATYDPLQQVAKNKNASNVITRS